MKLKPRKFSQVLVETEKKRLPNFILMKFVIGHEFNSIKYPDRKIINHVNFIFRCRYQICTEFFFFFFSIASDQ